MRGSSRSQGWILGTSLVVMCSEFWLLVAIGTWIIEDSAVVAALDRAHPMLGVAAGLFWAAGCFRLHYLITALSAMLFWWVLSHLSSQSREPSPA
jgi:hypothetical protein